MMPTAARMTGLVLFGVLAWLVSEQVKPLFPDGTNFGRFSEYNALIGMVCGWVVMGPRAGEGRGGAVGGGITTTVAVLFWGLLLHSIAEMLRLSLRKHYDGPVEAVVGVIQLAIEYVILIGTVPVMGTLFVGGIISGAICGWVARRWR